MGTSRLFISRASGATMSLVELCRYGELEGVKAALQAGADVNTKDKCGATGLIWAVFNNHNSVVDLLLKTPTIGVNWKNDEGWCALHFAVIGKYNNEGLKLLLNVPTIDVNIGQNHHGESAVHTAVIEDNIQGLELLLNVPTINVNIVNNNGESAVYRAVQSKNYGALKLLLGVPTIDVNIVNNDGESALHVAVSIKNNDMLKLLLNVPTIKVNIVNNRGESAVHRALIENNIEGFELLLKVPNINLETTMVALCYKGNLEGVRAALQRGVDVNEKDKDGWTGLMGALHYNHNSVVALLLNTPNIDVNWKSDLTTYAMHNAQCALHLPVCKSLSSKTNEALKLLLKVPTIDVNIVTSGGEHALHYA